MTNNYKSNLCLAVSHQYGVPNCELQTILFSEDAQLNTIRSSLGLTLVEYAWLDQVLCMVRWKAADAAWSLRHANDGFNYTVNDVLLASDKSIILRLGDHIEIGMLRLKVLAPTCSDQGLPGISANYVQSKLHGEDIKSDEVEPSPFPLMDSTGDNYWAQKWTQENPYDIVPVITLPDYAISNERQVEANVKQNSLKKLGSDYVKAILDPAALYSIQEASIHLAMRETKLLTPEQLATSLREQDTLTDILAGPIQGANYYIDKFQTDTEYFHRPGINKSDAMQRYIWDLKSNSNRVRPPELTRREHHAISPDSHFSLERAVPDSGTNDTNKK